MKPEFDPELISTYLDGETASREERELVEHHLEESSADAGMLDDFREIGKILRELPAETTPPGLLEAVHNQLEQEALLSRPAKKPASAKWSLRPVPLIASVSLFMLFLSVGTLYFVQNQFTAMNDPEAVIAMNLSPPGAGEVMFDESFALLDSSEFSLKSASTDDSVMESESSSATITMSRTKGKGADKLAIMKTEGLASRSAISEETPLTEMRAAKPSTSAAMTASPHGIPPLPNRLSKQSIKYINTLAASPKLQGILEPGELVHYVASNTLNQNISAIELSVVDVEEAFGTVQVLLTNNHIVSIEQVEGENLEATKNSTTLENAVEKDSSKKVPGENQYKEKIQNKLGKDQKEQLKNEGMIAFYVDAPHEQVLNSLIQLDEIENVHKVYIGNAPNLTGSSYIVESLVENGISRFDINKENSIAQQETKPGQEKETLQTDPVPRWSFSNGLAHNRTNHNQSLSGGTSFIDGVAKQGQKIRGLKKNPDKEEAENKNAPATASKKIAGETASKLPREKNAATAFDSFQIPVRLLPQSEKNRVGQTLSWKTKHLKNPSDSKAPGNSKGSLDIAKGKETQTVSSNHLRLLLIISLKQEE